MYYIVLDFSLSRTHFLFCILITIQLNQFRDGLKKKLYEKVHALSHFHM